MIISIILIHFAFIKSNTFSEQVAFSANKMGQKSSCCTYQDPPLQTEIDSKPDKQTGSVTDRESKGGLKEIEPMKSDLPRGLSLLSNDKANKILSPQAQQASMYSSENPQSIELRKQKLREIVHLAPVLELNVISSTVFPKGHKFTFNAQGVYNSFRNQKDGFTYFGSKKRLESKKKQGHRTEIINDCIIPSNNAEIDDRHRGRQFEISFDIPSNSYKLRDLGIGFGCFYKLDFPLTVKDHYLFSFGATFMHVNFQENTGNLNAQDISSLILKFYGGQCNGEVRILEPGPRPTVIGRHSDCEIQLNDNLVSKYQCYLKYVEKSGWTIYDGYENRPSTNGTWLYVGEGQTIYNGMIFKANQTLFQVNLTC